MPSTGTFPASIRSAPPALLTTEELAAYLGDVSVRTLEDWRRLGTGPDPCVLSPKMVRYRLAAVERWLEERERKTRAGESAS